MQSQKVESLAEFVRRIGLYDELLTSDVIFRGQPVRGRLLPGIARSDSRRDTTAVERDLLVELRRLGAVHLLEREETDLDLLVRAQHFGLKTRLLDWTSNPLAALWFACSDYQNCSDDAYVYALVVKDLMLPSDIYLSSPFETTRTLALRPRLNNARIFAQHGWFTLHHYSVEEQRFIALEENSHAAIYEYRVPVDKRHEMLVALDRCGISSRTMYPDLSGLCSFLNWKLSVS